MNIKNTLFFSFALLLFAGAIYPTLQEKTDPLTPEEVSQKEKIIMQAMISGLKQLHFKDVQINDDFSEKTFDTYLKILDGAKRFLVQEDIDQLKKYETDIDDEIKLANYEFFDLSVKTIESRILEAKGYYEEIIEKPFNFNSTDFIESDAKKTAYAENSKELKKGWEKLLKYEVLTRLTNMIEDQEDKEEQLSKEELEVKAIEKVKKLYDGWFERITKLERSDRLSDYLNAITSTYDPHTNYFAPIEKENFDISMSGRLEGIGARLSTEDGFTKVVSIVPGSACWKQGDLEVNDLITKVGQGKEEPVDIYDMQINDVVKKIRGKKGTTVSLTVKKVDGTTMEIPIVRDVVIMEEGYAKSSIIEKDGSRIGIISLPKFYADFSGKGGRNCSSDVANEIEKLKAENVEGIIMDLRNNGGGSLRDVVKMAGYFIETGPIVQVKGRSSDPEILYDKDPSVLFDGPLVIMVNSFSASASEILAAAMQDYNRAVVVGSKMTFGKGTVQRFIDLDRAVPGMADIKPLGEIKLTTQKFYRIDGGATQLKGVTPDVVIPDRYHYVEVGEQEHDNAMEWSAIDPVEFEQNVLKVKDLSVIKSSSQQRISANETFQKIDANAKYLKRIKDDTKYPLNFEDFNSLVDQRDEEAKAFKAKSKEIENLEISTLAVDLDAMASDSSKIARFTTWQKALKKDAYLEESISIMTDMIN